MHGESADIAKIRVEPTTTPTVSSPVVVASLYTEATGLSGKSTGDDDVSTHVEVIGSMLRVYITSQNDLKVLMAKINVGVYDEVIYGLTPDENKATFDAMMALWDKFPIVDPNADTSPASNAEVNDVSTINHHVHGLSYLTAATTKSILDPQATAVNEAPVLYAGAAGGVTSIPIKGKANFCYVKSNNVCEGVDLSIPMKVVQTTSSRFENTLYGYFIGKWIAFPVVEYYVRNNWAKYGLTRLMMNSKGFFFFKFDSNKGLEDVLENGPWMIRNSPIILKKWTMNTSLFKEELNRIPVWVKIHDVPLQVFYEDVIIKADEVLKESITMGIPMPEGMGFSKETVRVEYEWKPPRCDQCKIFGHVYDQCPKNASTTPTIYLNNDGFQMATWQPIKPKVRFETKDHGNSSKNKAPSLANDGPSRNRVPKVSTSAKVSQNNSKSHLKLSGEDVDSDEKVEVVYDESANLLKSTKTRASTSTTSDFQKTLFV
ncbi:zinc knuckle CX2CX4HX4C containing protein [Tanacetum coccineum]